LELHNQQIIFRLRFHVEYVYYRKTRVVLNWRKTTEFHCVIALWIYSLTGRESGCHCERIWRPLV